MNRDAFRLVFSRLRGMLVAVEESATAAGGSGGSRRSRRGVLVASLVGIVLGGAAPGVSVAQIVPGGEHAPSVVQTRNGLPQVDINRPSGAGVSVNTYGQFDVPPRGGRAEQFAGDCADAAGWID
ncbi:ESPR-type extended signal peptide-containing protein [Paraburkholderia sp. BCC1886]|uniref:ESPR-type extended signal peptide-containing protein n=1 Tax=Paraburkholderia sp. BCC1886 TaxID=2562670 RepID=UPI0028CB8722|nr:ESPR-type extended signal peptide-containing protein [Paraburkholderia sp. BCC1886]